MQAIRVHHFGDLDALVTEDVPRPSPGDGEVLLRVKAAGVGPWDAWIGSGRSVLPQPLPLTLGSDVSGLVERVGAGVSRFQVGDAVFGTTNARFTGGYASTPSGRPRCSRRCLREWSSSKRPRCRSWHARHGRWSSTTAPWTRRRESSFLAPRETSVPTPCSWRGGSPVKCRHGDFGQCAIRPGARRAPGD